MPFWTSQSQLDQYNETIRLRHLNTALHGAGSAMDTNQHAAPKRPTQEYTRVHHDPATVRMASEKQIGFIQDLRMQVALTAAQQMRLDHALDAGMTSVKASEIIDFLLSWRDKVQAARMADSTATTGVAKEAPTDIDRVVAYLRGRLDAGTINDFGQSLLEQYEARGSLSEKQIAAVLRGMPRVSGASGSPAPTKAPPARLAPLPGPGEVPAGRYAVEAENGELRFYRVARSKQDTSRVWLHVKHGPDESEVPYNHATYMAILGRIIEAGPGEAARRYGRELGACSRCGLDLTNRLSRELAVGPVCGGHFYEKDDWKTIKAQARSAIRARGEDPDESVEKED